MMWTHRTPYLPSELTSDSIRDHGKIALFRALNIGRLIAVVGSGATMAHGMPSWRGLIELYLQVTLVAIAQNDRRSQSGGSASSQADDATGRVARALAGVHALDDWARTDLSLRALWCELLLIVGAPPPDPDAEVPRETFEPTMDGDGDSLIIVFDICERIIRHLRAAPRPKGSFSGSRGNFSDLEKTVRAEFAKALAVLSKDEERCDDLSLPVVALRSTLAPSRMLTLNYDVELEKVEHQELNLKGSDTSRTFDDFLARINEFRDGDQNQRNFADDTPPNRRVEIVSGMRRALLSNRIKRGKVGEIVNFAAYSKQYDKQIAHLHGRLDAPESLVLSRGDYNRLYIQTMDARRAFEESLEVLFGGNSILFVGVGMTETDVLRPLQQFVADPLRSDQDAKQIFALLSTNYSVRGENLDPADPALQTWRRENTVRALDLKTRYNVQTIYYGDDDFRYAMRWVRWRQHELGASPTLADDHETRLDRAFTFEDKAHVDWRDMDGRGDHEALETRLRSLALSRQLHELARERERWWRDWQKRPREREARFSIAPLPIAGKADYLWLRHRTDYRWSWNPEPYSEDGLSAPADPLNIPENDFAPVRDLGKQALEVANKTQEDLKSDHEKKHGGLRILRAAIPRGGGKGSLVSILQRKEVHSSVFPRYIENKKPEAGLKQEYCKAFFAHLAFSTEFSSVITALSRLIARQLAELDWDKDKKVKAAYTAVKERGAMTDASDDDARARYIAGRELCPRLATEENIEIIDPDDLEILPVEPHRLDILRKLMIRFATKAEADDRLLVCLSGLERICDREGDGLSPMHRAFFRLIIGSELEPPQKPPIDLILLAGDDDAPICYLSDEVSHDDLASAAKKSKEAGEPGRKKVEEREISRRSKTGRLLRKWPRLSPYSLDDRQHLTPVSNPLNSPAIRLLHAWARMVGPWRTHRENGEHRQLRRMLGVDAGLQVWVQTALSQRFDADLRDAFRAEEIDLAANNFGDRVEVKRRETGAGPLDQCVRDFTRRLDQLDRAAASQGFTGVIGGVEALYHGIGARDGGLRSAALGEAIMRHLALFQLPVELWVLYGAPDIYGLLDGGRQAEEPALQEVVNWEHRDARLRDLHAHLTTLVERGLVIRLSGALHSDAVKDDHPTQFRAPAAERALHHRYALNLRLREHFAHKMRLRLPDGGESNHFQVSVFCDQPRDLPTPSPEHFKLVRNLVDRQIRLTRETLWVTYRNNPAGLPENPQDGQQHERNLMETRFAAECGVRRLLRPVLTADVAPVPDLADGFGRMHALTQRLRANFSLVRGAFSLGAISRMDRYPRDPGEDPPFETYRGWLRSLINAAAGIDFHKERYKEVFSGDASRAVETRLEELRKLDEPLSRDVEAGPGEKHVEHMALAADAMERTGNGKWRWRSQQSMLSNITSKPEDAPVRHPYYRDEIAWLYNERGLVSLVQGKLFDALPLFGQAQFMMQHRSASPEFDGYAHRSAERRILLNIAITRIDRGEIETARQLLVELIHATRNVGDSTPSDLLPYAEGYLALCDHLSGNLQRAVRVYERVINLLSRRGRLRPVSIFNRHLALALMRRGDLSSALTRGRLAVDAAAHSEQRDVHHEALLTQAQLLMEDGDNRLVLPTIERAIGYARRMGLDRMIADAQIRRAEALVREGETESAGRSATEAIAISMRNGLGLRKLEALIVYGGILKMRQEYDIAHAVLEEANRNADRIGYQTMAARAQDLIAELPD